MAKNCKKSPKTLPLKGCRLPITLKVFQGGLLRINPGHPGGPFGASLDAFLVKPKEEQGNPQSQAAPQQRRAVGTSASQETEKQSAQQTRQGKHIGKGCGL